MPLPAGGMEGVGEAGRVYQLEGYDMPDFPVSDGNSGVNLRVPNIGMPSGVTYAQLLIGTDGAGGPCNRRRSEGAGDAADIGTGE